MPTQVRIATEEVCSAIVSAVRGSPSAGSPDEGAHVPSSADVATAIDAVFWALTTEEEGRRVSARIAWSSPHSMGLTWSPLDLTTENLRKLGPHFDDAESWLIIESRADGPVIVGSRRRPAGLRIEVSPYGALVVSHWFQVLATFEAGYWRLPNLGLTDVQSMIHDGFGKFPQGHVVAAFALSLAFEARRHRRGGLFVFTDKADHDRLSTPKVAITDGSHHSKLRALAPR
jgi:hypothetical protein